MGDESRHLVTCVADQELVSEGLVSVTEAAAFLGLSRSKVYDLMEQGELRYAKLGRSRRVPKRELIKLAARSLIQR